MNRKKRRYLIETGIVALILVFLCIAVFPSFFRSQRSRTLIYAFQYLDAILASIQQYQIEHGRVPDVCTPFRSSTTSKTIQNQWIVLDDGYWRNSRFFLDQTSVLRKEGYFLDIPASSSSPLTDSLPIYCLQIHTNDGADGKRILNQALMIQWPFSNQNENNAVTDCAQTARDRFLNRFTVERAREPFILPAFYYAPSNGIESSGLIYIDIHGNHSPFGREQPVLTLVQTSQD